MSFKKIFQAIGYGTNNASMENKESSETSDLMNQVVASLEALNTLPTGYNQNRTNHVLHEQQRTVIKSGLDFLRQRRLVASSESFYIDPFNKPFQSTEDRLKEGIETNKRALEFIKDKIK